MCILVGTTETFLGINSFVSPSISSVGQSTTTSVSPSPLVKSPGGGSTRNRFTNFQFSQACSIGSGSFFAFSHSATLSSSSSMASSPSSPPSSSISSSSNPFLLRSSLANLSFLAVALAFSSLLKVSMPVIKPRSGLARNRRASLHFRNASGAGSLYSIPNLAARAFAFVRSFSYSANNSASVGMSPPPPLDCAPYPNSRMLIILPPSSIGIPSKPKCDGIPITTTLRTRASLAFLCKAELPMPIYLTASTPLRNISYILSSNTPIQFLPGQLPTPADNFPPCNIIQYDIHFSSLHTREGNVTSTHSE